MGRIRIRDGDNILQVVKRISLRDSAGQPVLIRRVRVRDSGGTLRTVFAGLSVTISPNPVEGLGTSGATADVTTAAAIATAEGFVTPTYSWALKGTSSYSWTIGTATAASTTFTALSVPDGAFATAVFTVTVTSSDGSVLYADVTANARNNYTLGTGTGGSSSGSGTGITPTPYGGGYSNPDTAYP
jgi:hypothetical protein